MKQLFKYAGYILICSVLIFTQSSCKKLSNDQELRIDITSDFANDDLLIKLDDIEIYNRANVSTDHTLGLTDIVQLSRPTGRYDLIVRVNDNQVTKTFRSKKNPYITISYDEGNSEIGIAFPEEFNVYD